ncbi:metallophosphoesterase 1 isoform X1 [Esox lucius]|uniref:Metallophosphoesterase 1 n=2 Tax=Esox lucius TaxID=8010 RepID=A0AAY5KZD4_ESOLU|nr:metallophosphoesterase 1 isoform X1 [Esox lucius]
MQGLSVKCKFSLTFTLFLSVICVFIFCEYLIYYPAILRCSWPELKGDREVGVSPLHALFLSDTHLLGAIKGHWFDKLRREWQMERAFQTALGLQKPEVVFILGDIFDEGKWSSPKDWEDDVRRFKQIFRHPRDMELIVIIGNHDIGFHHEMNWYKLERFERVFNVTSARIVTKKGVNFVLVNSMALHGDRCPICEQVENELYSLSQTLNCSMKSQWSGSMRRYCQEEMQKYPPSLSILLQHFPLYRPNDAECTGQDAASPDERNQVFHERYDVLSQEASQRLLWWFQPRLILSGHTHSACEVVHNNKHPEISVPSFSWRNRNDPSFILGTFSPTDFQLAKCFLPEESSVVAIYCATAMVLILLLMAHIHFSKNSMILATSLLGKHKGL